MEINGLPLHPLVVHAAVVLTPLAALLALASLVPALRDRLRWPTAATALAAAVSVLLAYISGTSFREANEFFNDPSTSLTRQIDTHQARGTALMWWTLAFAACTLLATALAGREGWLRWLVSALLGALALVVVVLVALTGDSGARAVWGGIAG